MKTARKVTTKADVAKLQPADVIPGEVILGQGDIVAFEGRQTVELTVANTGDRPIQVGSHCHFFEANRALRFDREKAFGFRLQVPAGTAVRFEPGEEKRVTLVAFGGNRVAHGINGLTNGRLDDSKVKEQALARAVERGFMAKKESV
ncbi:MAG: urease subunit beta [Nitrospiraceae bacterium]